MYMTVILSFNEPTMKVIARWICTMTIAMLIRNLKQSPREIRFTEIISRKSNALLLARYDEDTNWLPQLNLSNTDTFLYNKGNATNVQPYFSFYETPKNIGREGGTYLK